MFSHRALILPFLAIVIAFLCCSSLPLSFAVPKGPRTVINYEYCEVPPMKKLGWSLAKSYVIIDEEKAKLTFGLESEFRDGVLQKDDDLSYNLYIWNEVTGEKDKLKNGKLCADFGTNGVCPTTNLSGKVTRPLKHSDASKYEAQFSIISKSQGEDLVCLIVKFDIGFGPVKLPRDEI